MASQDDDSGSDWKASDSGASESEAESESEQEEEEDTKSKGKAKKGGSDSTRDKRRVSLFLDLG